MDTAVDTDVLATSIHTRHVGLNLTVPSVLGLERAGDVRPA